MRKKSLFKAGLFFPAIFLVILGSNTASKSNASSAPSAPLEGAFVANDVIIGIDPAWLQELSDQDGPLTPADVTSLAQLNTKYGVEEIAPVFPFDLSDPIAIKYGLPGVFKLTVPMGTDIFSMIAEYQMDPSIAYAELNRIYVATDLPNDTDFGEQWALHNTGQTGGLEDADIDAPEAWEVETGNDTILIAIIDTGVDYTHSDLSGGRVRTDIDRDFINDDEDAMDDHGHGTYVAGIAAADTNNQNGIAGICQGCQILPVKVLDAEGSGDSASVAQGIQYAADKNAHVISMSLGYPSNCGCSYTVANAINYAFEKGSLLIAASGNDSDKERISYPAASPRVLSVGASDHEDQETDFSNRNGYLDIVAPGKDVYSLDPEEGFRLASGTSAAAPHVSGVAGLVFAAESNLSNAEVWWRLYQSADDFPAVPAQTLDEHSVENAAAQQGDDDMPFRVYLPGMAIMRSTFGRLNAYRSLTNTISGQMHAPVDMCSSEPSGCVPGCGAEVALVGTSTVVEDLQLLRQFRDEVLEPQAFGHYWAEKYQANRLEVALILAADPELRSQARIVLDAWLPLVYVLVNPDSQEQPILTEEHLDLAETFMMTIIDQARPQLRADLEEAGELVTQGYQYTGMDVREAWKSFLESIENNTDQ